MCINQHNKTVFARMHGIVPLAKLLISTHHRVLKYTLWALAIVGINKENSQEICKAGAIPLILGLLKSSDDTIQQYAAGALMTLSTNPANQQVIITVGGISRLVEVLSTRVESDNQYDFQLCTMCTLVQIAKSKFSEKNAIAKADGIPAIVRLVSSKKDYISMKAMTVRLVSTRSLHFVLFRYFAVSIAKLILLLSCCRIQYSCRASTISSRPTRRIRERSCWLELYQSYSPVPHLTLRR